MVSIFWENRLALNFSFLWLCEEGDEGGGGRGITVSRGIAELGIAPWHGQATWGLDQAPDPTTG